MREVRMTFGEHLEELRRRIIWCLFYLIFGVTISLVYGKELMEWTLGPHYRAIRGAQRDRLVGHIVKTLNRVKPLWSAKPVELPPGEKPLLQDPPQPGEWAVLFAAEVATPLVEGRIQEPFDRLAARLQEPLAAVPEAERAKVVEAVKALGGDLSRVLARELSPGLAGWSLPDVYGRLVKMTEALKKTQDLSQAGKLQGWIGWGRDPGEAVEVLSEFLQFLDGQRAEALKAGMSLEELHARARQSKLADALGEVVASLDEDTKAIVEEKPIRLMVIDYLESFMAYLKVALIFGVFITLPFMLYEMWKFVGAGLYTHEQKYVVTLLPFSLALFVAGCLFGYYAMIPVGLRFLATWGIEDVNLSFTLESYIGLFFTLTLILGLVFQTPLLMIFFARIGVVDVAKYRKMRRIAIFVGVCLSIVLTPPDPFSWSLMALPMIVLYEVGILACQVLDRKRLQEEAAERPSETRQA